MKNVIDVRSSYFRTTIVEDLRNVVPVVFLHYFDSRDNTGAKTSYQGFLLSVLQQAAFQQDAIHPGLQALYQECRRGLSTPAISQLEHTLKYIMNQINQGLIILDAFDECDKAAQTQVQKWVVAMSGKLSSVFTSRIGPPARIAGIHRIALGKYGSEVDDDIATYLQSQFEDMEFDEDFQDKVVARLKQDSQGMQVHGVDA